MNKKTSTPSVNMNEEILTPSEAGRLFNVSGWAMYKRAKNGLAPSHKIGTRVYFLKSELIAFTENS
jgi:hypothetical protein